MENLPETLPAPPCGADRPAPLLAYVMSRFPKLTETFVLYEILALQRLGFRVHIYPLLEYRDRVAHPEALTLETCVHNAPPWSARVLGASLRRLARHPRSGLATLWEVIRGNLGSPALLLRALVLFPKMVWIAEAMQRQGIDHIHAHFATHPALAALVARRLTGIGYSFTSHGSDIHVDQTMLGHKIAASRFCVMISEYNRRFVIKRCREPIRDRLVVVRTGIDPEVFHARARSRAASEALRILMVASLGEVKGHRVLIQACRLLDGAGIDFHCELAGDGPLKASLSALAQDFGLSHRVHLLGPRTRPQVAELMQQSDVLVMPSILTRDGRREGIPVVLMEAMASGLAVVASRLSGIPELVRHEDTGLLFDPGEHSALAAALGRLAADPALGARLGKHARSFVLENYDLHENTRRLAQLFCAW